MARLRDRVASKLLRASAISLFAAYLLALSMMGAFSGDLPEEEQR